MTSLTSRLLIHSNHQVSRYFRVRWNKYSANIDFCTLNKLNWRSYLLLGHPNKEKEIHLQESYIRPVRLQADIIYRHTHDTSTVFLTSVESRSKIEEYLALDLCKAWNMMSHRASQNIFEQKIFFLIIYFSDLKSFLVWMRHLKVTYCSLKYVWSVFLS